MFRALRLLFWGHWDDRTVAEYPQAKLWIFEFLHFFRELSDYLHFSQLKMDEEEEEEEAKADWRFMAM